MSKIPSQPRTSIGPRLFRRELITVGAMAMAGIACLPSPAISDPNAEILKSEEAIHQERVFKAGRRRIYEALAVESQFDKIVQLSGVTKADPAAAMQRPTKLSPNEGGAFSLFAGYIVGRQIELVPNELIVQAWRVLNWPTGMYSIARFALMEQDGSTKIVFDHKAFPKGAGEHLASGWQEHYWDPLTKFLA
jgi:hypothetical protein